MTAANPTQTRFAGPAGVEPPATGLGLDHEEGRSIRATWRGAELFRYVYEPWEPQLESPKPYFHPLRTLDGELVSLYRPHDHVWHKGISLSLCTVGTENFWGGPTYRRDSGYEQLANNGTMRHEGFDRLSLADDVLRFDERLAWVTEAGDLWISEQRRVAVTALPDSGAWRLSLQTSLHNVSGATIPFGSPTTEGRENAGYSGLFWRGPRSFDNGTVIMPDAEGGDELMGRRGEWLAFAGRHDGAGIASTVLFRDDPRNFSYPSQWFVRSGVYACVCPAPFFEEEHHRPTATR